VSHGVFQLDLDAGYYKDEKIFSYPCLNLMSRASYYSDTLSISLSCGMHLGCSAYLLITVAGLAPNSGLLGTTPEDAALVDQWVHFGETEIATWNETIFGMIMSYVPYSKPVIFLLAT